MFAQLIASRPVRRRSPAGFAASLVLHGVIVAGAIITTSRTAGPREPLATHVLPIYREPVPEPPRVAPTPRPPAPGSPVAIGPDIISVPIEIPDFIPPVNPLRALINTDQPLEFRIGTPTRPGAADPGALTSGSVLLVDQVEIAVVLDKRSPLPRFPQLLRDAGVEGMARLSFVVDTLGRVEPGTVTVMASTHPAFAVAVQATLPRMRFTPARVGRHAGWQLVELPVQFRLDR